jgi:hypothetical protein
MSITDTITRLVITFNEDPNIERTVSALRSRPSRAGAGVN